MLDDCCTLLWTAVGCWRSQCQVSGVRCQLSGTGVMECWNDGIMERLSEGSGFRAQVAGSGWGMNDKSKILNEIFLAQLGANERKRLQTGANSPKDIRLSCGWFAVVLRWNCGWAGD